MPCPSLRLGDGSSSLIYFLLSRNARGKSEKVRESQGKPQIKKLKIEAGKCTLFLKIFWRHGGNWRNEDAKIEKENIEAGRNHNFSSLFLSASLTSCTALE